MLNDIIEQFMKSKNMTNFDFSLRPNHDIDNPFAKTSMDIIDRLQQSIEKADKSVLGDVLLDEAKEIKKSFFPKLTLDYLFQTEYERIKQMKII